MVLQCREQSPQILFILRVHGMEVIGQPYARLFLRANVGEAPHSSMDEIQSKRAKNAFEFLLPGGEADHDWHVCWQVGDDRLKPVPPMPRAGRPTRRPLDIEKALEAGEGDGVEFKSTLEVDLGTGGKNPVLVHSVLKTIAGFLNTEGGTLILGVDDHRNVLGLAKDYALCKKADRDGFEQKLRDLILSRISPSPYGRISVVFRVIDGEDVCGVLVTRSRVIVHLDHKDVFKREGNETRKLEPEALPRWIEERLRESPLRGGT